MADDNQETILIVDDEEPVRRTFREWLTGGGLSGALLEAADAESALKLANQHPIDLTILDWALGAGDDGLQLLQDLYAFHPDVVAIMVTGFANQATPLDAMRMGVRDYLDKNHDLTRETFLTAVRRQLEHIRPAKRARKLNQSLAALRDAVAKIMPLVQSAAALNEPVPLPDAIHSLIRFLLQTTRAESGVLLVRRYDPAGQPNESTRVYDATGQAMETKLVPFARSVAGTAASMQEACVMNDLNQACATIELQPFERGKRNLLAVPMMAAQNVQAIFELFDKPGGFSADDQRLVKSAADVGADLLRQALGQRQTQEMLLDAVAAALSASEQVSQTLNGPSQPRPEQPPPPQVLEQLRQGLSSTAGDLASAELSVRLAEAIRVLAHRHGSAAVEHCLRLVEQVRGLLDKVAG
ncbi:MAG: response regulator [Planctomycetes bacterium]|nr:response regulator [Planctomycetota bacterium]